MQKKSFIALAAVTAVAIVGAVVALEDRQEAAQVAPSGGVLYVDLVDQINDVNRVAIRSADDRFTMERQGERWVMSEHANYPVDFSKVRGMLLQLARLETVEPRTSKPDLYARLGVEDLDQPEPKSVQVTVYAKDEMVADLLVGRTRTASEGGGLFVREAAKEQAWLAKGDLRPDKGFVSWLDRNIANVDQRRVRTVTIAHADGDKVVVEKSQPTAGDYVLETPVPEGREPKEPHELSPLPSITDFLILEDVRPAAELDWSAPAVTARFQTYDGLLLAMEAVEADGKTWVRLKAEAIDSAAETAALVEANKGKDSAEGRIVEQFKSAEDVAAEVEAINARTDGWAYRLTDYKTGKLKSGTEDLTQEKKAPEPAADAAPKAESDGSGQTVN